MPLVGSSRISSRGSCTIAAAILSRCFIPVEYDSISPVPRLAQPDVVEHFVGALQGVARAACPTSSPA